MDQDEKGNRVPENADGIVTAVRDRYGKIAESGGEACCSPAPAATPCCGGSPHEVIASAIGYGEDDLASLPEGTNLGLGCGAPVESLRLQEGETVLDLGSGAGIDAFLAARQVGPGGRVIGVDMTPAMLERARRNARTQGMHQVEFREGRLESLPVDDGSVDAVASNCVINLVPDKGAVFREVARVLKPGGRVVLSDIVLDGALPDAVRDSLLAYVGCIAGAMQRQAYLDTVREAGLVDVEILKDVDYLATVGFKSSIHGQDVEGVGAVDPEELEGKVRSVTLRARKRG